MKTYIRILLTAILAAIAAGNALAANSERYFDSLSLQPGYDYSYISPTILKAMGEQYLSDRAYGSLPVMTSDLTSLEMVSTASDGQNDELWKMIRDLKKSKKLETLSTKKQDAYRYDVLARMTNDSKYITHLMVITQNGGYAVDVVYMEGKIPVESLRYDLMK